MARKRAIASTLAALRNRVLPAGGLRRRLIEGSAWSVFGTGVAQAFGLLTNVVTARLLGRDAYGELGMALTTVNTLTVVGALGLGVTATRFIAESRATDPARTRILVDTCLRLTWVSSAIVAILLGLGANVLSTDLLKAGQLRTGFIVSSLLIVVSSVNGTQLGALAGLENFEGLAKSSICRGLAGIAFIPAGAHFWGLDGALVGYVVAGAATLTYTGRILRETMGDAASTGSAKAQKSPTRELLRFTVPVLLSGIAFAPAAWWTNALIAKRAGFGELALFNAASQCQTIILFLANAVSAVGLPLLSNSAGMLDRATYVRTLRATGLAHLSATTVVAIPVAIFAPYLLRLWGPTFGAGSTVLMILSFAAIVNSINNTVGQVIWSLNRPMLGMSLSLFRAVVLCAGTYLWVDRGATGLALATLSLAVVLAIIQIPIAWRIVARACSQPNLQSREQNA